MSSQNANFFDVKTITAIALVGLSWIGWQSYMQNKYPDMYSEKKEQVAKDTAQVEEAQGEAAPAQAVVDPKSSTLAVPKQAKVQERTVFTFEDKLWSFEISNKGMGIKNLTLFDYKGRNFEPKKIGKTTNKSPFETHLIGAGAPLFFNIKKVSDTEFVGITSISGLRIEKRLKIVSEKHVIESQVFVSGIRQSETFAGLVTNLVVEAKPAEDGFLFLPSFERREAYISYDGQDERILFTDENVTESFSKVNLVSLNSQYFAQAFLDESEVLPRIEVDLDMSGQTASTSVTHSILNKGDEFSIKYKAFIGPKSFNLLNSVDPQMTELIDFGWFGSLAKYILKLMKLFYGMVGNWGTAIIMLTVLVRIVVLPFNLISFKSMKKMQDIQPQIKALKEKFKDDPQKQQQEMMLLMRENKVNPLGGCLPMLLQFPVFIALYQVLGQSIELYQAPFIFWIHDLSLKDPYYVLPVLMAVTMFLQQKLTPSTMDPTQQKVFMIMPVLFALFMVSLPSGLTLYIFVSALFAVVQQAIFLRAKAV